MFSDFDASAKREEDGRGRRTISLVLAALIFLGLAAGIAAAVATASAVIERREREVEVAFAELPEPEPEPPPPPPPAPRPRASRPTATVDAPPTSIPDARPEEAEGELGEATDVGPYGEGEEDGVDPPRPRPAPVVVLPPPPEPPPGPPRPPAPPPSQERIEVSPPELLSGCSRPDRPEALEGATAETITIYVRLIVGLDGRVLRASIEEAHALIPDETVLACMRERIYAPAHLPDGTPVPYPLRYAFTFRPDVL